MRRHNHQKKSILPLVLIALVLTVYMGIFLQDNNRGGQSQMTYSVLQLNEDLDQIERAILRENPMIFSEKEDFIRSMNLIRQKVDHPMSESEFYRLINPTIVDIRCGHTVLSISKKSEADLYNQNVFFPLKVRVYNDKVYLANDSPQYGLKKGDELISLNNRKMSAILSDLIDNISSDGTSNNKRWYMLNKFFANKYQAFIETTNSFDADFKRGDQVVKVLLKGTFSEGDNTNAWGLHFQGIDESEYYQYQIHDDYAVLDVNLFMASKAQAFKPFLRAFFETLDKSDVKKLIIDVRGNYGGDPKMAKLLLSYLVDQASDYFTSELPVMMKILGYGKVISPAENPYRGEVVLLTDGGCFSTTGHFVSAFKYYGLGEVMGQATDGSYRCSDSSKEIVLKNTGLRLHYSTQVFSVVTDQTDYGNGIEPNLVVEPSLIQLLDDKDVVMERAIQ